MYRALRSYFNPLGNQMLKTLALNIAAISLLGACTGTIVVHSTPEGALISSDKQTLGVSPYVIHLNPDISKTLPLAEDGCYGAPPFTAHWASGAVASSPVTPLCKGLDGNYQILIRRPTDAPDLQKDLEAANQREDVLARRREAQAINNVATSVEMGGMPMGYGGWR
jgi:hypothetical protein